MADAVDSVRLLHLTDLHLRWHQPGSAKQPERLSREMPAVLERLGARLAEFEPDVLVVTGDLLDVPDEVIDGSLDDEAALLEAADAAEADYRIMRDWFVGTGLPYVVIPGNHDLDEAFRRVFPEAQPVADIAGLRFVCFHDELDETRTPQRRGESRALFDAVLSEPGHDRPQVHLQHYMVEPPTYTRWPYDYEGSRAMAAAIEGSGRVRALLSGHYHPGSLFMGAGGVCYSVVPAFCSAPHPIRLMDIRQDGGVQVFDASVDGE